MGISNLKSHWMALTQCQSAGMRARKHGRTRSTEPATLQMHRPWLTTAKAASTTAKYENCAITVNACRMA